MRASSTLLSRFSFIGVTVTLAMAAALGYVMQAQLTRDAVADTATLAAAQVVAGASPYLRPEDLSGHVSEQRIAELDRRVMGDGAGYGSVILVKIWNPQGVVVYSNEKQLIGQNPSTNDDLRAALSGRIVSEMSDLSKPENVDERKRFGRLLEAYVPLRLAGSDEIVGVYEIYCTVEQLESRIGRIRRTVAVGVFGSFAALYAALFGLVYGASRRLTHQASENEQLAKEVVLAYDQTIEGWSSALDLRDEETEGHSRRVTDMTVAIAATMGFTPDQLVDVRRGALLHDIGKMGVPDAILHKQGPLDKTEWEIMREHPGYANRMLEPIGYLGSALEIPYCHHERWDGSGYPRGLSGEQIPLSARIFAIVDVWDALSSNRPYRPAWSADEVREKLLAESGKHFDPQVVTTFLRELNGRDLDRGPRAGRLAPPLAPPSKDIGQNARR